jgi:outer membrane receptor protein involved in Fe transport
MKNFTLAVVSRTRETSKILAVMATAMLVNSAALAQDVFEEIIVTAQKREQNIMDVPIAVSAITGTQIVDAGISTMFDLQQNVPSLLVNASQTATTSNFSIRGIGSTANNFGVESSVGLYVDGVYRSRQSSLINDLVDVEAVEILRGPQGTLFGKNTPAGAIQVRTVAPSQDRDAFIDVTAGDYSLVQVSAAANIPINDNLAFRGTVFSTQRDGYVDDIALGKDVYNDRDRIGASGLGCSYCMNPRKISICESLPITPRSTKSAVPRSPSLTASTLMSIFRVFQIRIISGQIFYF